MAYGEPLNSPDEYEGLFDLDLVTRMVYAEARGESDEGKAGCAYVVKNRKDKNLTEFGGTDWGDIVTHPGQFAGMLTESALKPDTSSDAWTKSLQAARDVVRGFEKIANPIGTCLWFNSNTYYQSVIVTRDNKEYYNFGAGEREVVEKVVIGNHTFFRVSGY